MINIDKDVNTAYFEDMLYIPKTKVRKTAITGALEFKISVGRKTEEIQLWKETPTHLAVPRYFIPKENYSKYSFKVEKRVPTFPKFDFEDIIKLRDDQLKAWDAFDKADCGILNLAPGKGKTVLALKKILTSKVPALIIVNNTYLKDQWIERIKEFTGIDDIGVIQGPDFIWEKPICVAMIHTLADRIIQDRIPVQFYEHFGMAIYDEVHHLGASYFSKTATICRYGMRFGLTATTERADGLDCVYRYHIGPVFFSDNEYHLNPEIIFQETPLTFDLESKDVRDKFKQLNIPKLISVIGKKEESIEFRYQQLKKYYDTGRKIIALSQSKDQLKILAKRFDNSALIIQETDPEKRTKMVRESKIAFVISRLGLEGLDDDKLDTLFFLSPIGADKTLGPNGIKYLGNRVTQGFGRILRKAEKNPPLVIFFDDVNIGPLHFLCTQVKRFLNTKEIPFSVSHYNV